MAASPWNSMADVFPTDGEVVWIRVLNYYGEPFRAKWRKSAQTFTTITTNLVIPGYYIARWRSL